MKCHFTKGLCKLGNIKSYLKFFCLVGFRFFICIYAAIADFGPLFRLGKDSTEES